MEMETGSAIRNAILGQCSWNSNTVNQKLGVLFDDSGQKSLDFCVEAQQCQLAAAWQNLADIEITKQCFFGTKSFYYCCNHHIPQSQVADNDTSPDDEEAAMHQTICFNQDTASHHSSVSSIRPGPSAAGSPAPPYGMRTHSNTSTQHGSLLQSMSMDSLPSPSSRRSLQPQTPPGTAETRSTDNEPMLSPAERSDTSMQ